MRRFTVAIAVLVVVSGLVAALPASAVGDRPAEPAREEPTGEIEARAPPDLPEQWQQTFGGDGDDMFSDLVRTDDGGYLVVGWKRGESTDGWVLKVNGEGEKQWEKTLGGSKADLFWGVTRTDEGYLLAGRTTTESGIEGWVVELGPDGEVHQERTAGSGTFAAVTPADSSDDAGYLLTGWTRTSEGMDGIALKLDEDLSREWQANYSTPEGYENGYLRAVVPTEGGYYLAGKIEGDSDDAWAMKIDSDGNRIWQKTAGSSGREDVWAAAPASANGTDSGFVLAGETGTDPRDGWLVRFDANGTIAWERTPGSDGTRWFDSAMRTDDGFLFTGSSNDGPTEGVDGYVLKTDAEGEAEWERYYATPGWDKPWPAIRAHGGGYLLAGQTSDGDAGGMDGWLLRIGNESASNDAGTDSETSANDTDTDDPSEGTGTAETTDSAIQSEADATATEGGTQGSVPGLGIGAALLALVALLFIVRQ